MTILPSSLICLVILFPLITIAESNNDPPIASTEESSPIWNKQWKMTPPDSVNLKPRVVNFNIMVAGLSGLGKTTFCKALLDSWMESADEPTESTKKKKKNFGKGGGINAQTLSVQASSPLEWYDDTANTLLRVRIIDTPGFGNKVNHKNSVLVIRKYIQSCRKEQMQQEMSSRPSLSFRKKQEEQLVHVCLYFLSPGRFLEIDRHFLKHVQHEVPIVPIIAKSDTLTDEEISEYRALLKKTLEQERIQVYDFDSIETDVVWEPRTFSSSFFRGKRKEKNTTGGTNSFPTADPSDARLIRAVLQKTTLQNRNYRGRKKSEALAIIARDGMYPWGEAISQDPHHSDLRLIRDLLLSEHTERFLEQSQMQYQQYRTRCIAQGKFAGRLKQSTFMCLVALQLATTFKLDHRIRKMFSRATSLLLSLRIGSKQDKETSTPIEVEDIDGSLLLEDSLLPEETPKEEEMETGRSRGMFGLFGTPSYDRSVGQTKPWL